MSVEGGTCHWERKWLIVMAFEKIKVSLYTVKKYSVYYWYNGCSFTEFFYFEVILRMYQSNIYIFKNTLDKAISLVNLSF